MPQAASRTAHVADFTFKVGDLTTEDLKVTRFEGTEGVSQLYHFRIEFCSDQADVPYASVVGKPCVLEIGTAYGSRFVHGMVRRFGRTGEGTNLTHYAADVVPVHWLLTKRRRSRIFQNLSVPDIIKKIFTDAGIPNDRYRFATSGSYAALEYVVQYRETEFDFISRLMEREGIFYFFEHAADGHKMVLGDAPVAHVDTPNQAEFAFRSPTGLVPEQDREHIFALQDSEEMQEGFVSLDDFNFQQPATDLRSEASGQNSALFHSDYPGDFQDRGVGQTYATVRLEEFQCAKRVQQMTGTTRGLLPGFKFTLIEHPNDALNIEYLVTHLSHHASEPQAAAEEAGAPGGPHYEVDIRTIPADVPFRPPRRTPRPVVEGTQTALVVGPAGEEIYTDNYGRVKVQFHWDDEGQYDDKSSCWIRVSQGSAGGQYGLMFLPRVGQEVIVDFLEGDPDRPIITGRVYNKDQMPPYPLPDEKTKSTIKTNSSKGGGGTNEIRFEDAKGKEQILIYAQKALHVRANGSRFESIGGDRHLTVAGDKFETAKKNKHVKIALDQNTQIDGNVSLKVAGNVGEEIAGNHSESTSGNLYLKVGGDIVIEAGGKLTLKVGGNFVMIDAGGVTIVGTQTKINSGGAAGSGSAVALKAAEDAKGADSAKPGKDVTYSPAAKEYEALEVEPGAFTPVEVPTEEEEPLSWVEVELVDDQGQPVPYEPYEATLPNGRVIRGTLDRNGLARISGIQPGQVEFNFVNLDREGWSR